MRKIFIGFVLMLAFLPISVDAADVYYVDATNGNNSNDGLSPETAWQTIAKVNGWSFSPGDNILFKRGEVWREQLRVPSSGNAANPITFEAYGSGPRPVISGGDLVTGWEQNYTNVWNATLTTNPYQLVFDSSQWGDEKTSIASLSDEYDWYWASNVLYIYSTSDPDTAYTSVEAMIRNNCIDTGPGVDRSYVTIDGLELKNAWKNGILFRSVSGASSNLIAQNCVIHHIGNNYASDGDGIEFQGCSNNKAINNTVYECGRHGIFIIAYANAADNNTIEFNTLYDHYYAAIDILVDVGDPASCDGNIVRYNYVYGTGGGWPYDFPGVHVKGQTGNLVTNTEIYYNVINNVPDNGIKIQGDVSPVYIYDNSIYLTGWSNTAAIQLDNGDGTAVVKNNIGSEPQTYAVYVADSTNKIIDHNCWYLSGGFNSYVDGASRNWVYWQGTAGFDGNGLNSDPLFVNAPGEDFHLQPSSPAIDAGTYVDLTQDFEGNPVPQGSAPDIGAYESGELPADLDNDGDVDIQDLITVTSHFGLTDSDPDWDETADVVEDGEIDIYDIVFVASRFSEGVQTKELHLVFGVLDQAFANIANNYALEDDFILVKLKESHIELLGNVSKGRRMIIAPSIDNFTDNIELVRSVNPEYLAYDIEHGTDATEGEKADPVAAVKAVYDFAHENGFGLMAGTDSAWLDEFGAEMAEHADMFLIMCGSCQVPNPKICNNTVYEECTKEENEAYFEEECRRRIQIIKNANPNIPIFVQINTYSGGDKPWGREVTLEEMIISTNSISDLVDGISVYVPGGTNTTDLWEQYAQWMRD